MTLKLSHRSINRAVVRGLVRVSASWSSDERNRIEKDLEATRSRTKCKSISIFFVHALKSGFALRYLADSSYVVTPQNRRRTVSKAMFTQQILEPKNFNSRMGNCSIFRFVIEMRNRSLLARTSKDQVTTKVETESRYGATIIRTASPIYV